MEVEGFGRGLVKHRRGGAGLMNLNINAWHREHEPSLRDGIVNGKLRAAAAYEEGQQHKECQRDNMMNSLQRLSVC